MNRYWVSWYQPTDDERPITFPPNPAILGWWCTGEKGDGSAFTICALVRALSPQEAQQAVLTDWPEVAEYRFFSQVESGWKPPEDRFPRSSWMLPRMNREAIQ